ncbi:MAG: hypothetical protein HC869_25915 [Rhodospirillales bacterium]|nr:hypothetical protein [Rhodospirillales bacterium]
MPYFVRTKQDLLVHMKRAGFVLAELAAVETVLRNLRAEFASFADRALNADNSASRIKDCDTLITKAERLQSVTENAGPSASEVALEAFTAQLAPAERKLSALSAPGSRQKGRQGNGRRARGSDRGRGRGNGRSNGREDAATRRARGDPPPGKCQQLWRQPLAGRLPTSH